MVSHSHGDLIKQDVINTSLCMPPHQPILSPVCVCVCPCRSTCSGWSLVTQTRARGSVPTTHVRKVPQLSSVRPPSVSVRRADSKLAFGNTPSVISHHVSLSQSLFLVIPLIPAVIRWESVRRSPCGLHGHGPCHLPHSGRQASCQDRAARLQVAQW